MASVLIEEYWIMRRVSNENWEGKLNKAHKIKI
jgi:purine-cytosine permease-like protein